MYIVIGVLYLLFELSAPVRTAKYDSTEISKIIEEGKKEYNLLEQRSNIPRFGGCWKSAVSFLQVGCKHLTDEIQSDIALKLTDCFLIMSGHGPYECDKQLEKKGCVKGMTDRAFNVYTEFYSHAFNLCFFLQSQIWHDETERTIDRLSSSSAHVAKQLEEAETVQVLLLEQQKRSMSVQEKLLENGLSLSETLHVSQDSLHAIMHEFRTSTLEQKKILFEVFDRLASLQAWAIGEISWLDTIIFYVGCIIVCYIVTATPRTHEARIWVFLAVTFNAVLERFVFAYLLQDNTDHIEIINENMSWWIWQCRKVMLAICVVLIGLSVYNFCDYNTVNHKLLLQIRKQNMEVIQCLEKLQNMDTEPNSEILTIDTRTDYSVSKNKSLSELTRGAIKRQSSLLGNIKMDSNELSSTTDSQTHMTNAEKINERNASFPRKTEHFIEETNRSMICVPQIINFSPRVVQTRQSRSPSVHYNLRHSSRSSSVMSASKQAV